MWATRLGHPTSQALARALSTPADAPKKRGFGRRVAKVVLLAGTGYLTYKAVQSGFYAWTKMEEDNVEAKRVSLPSDPAVPAVPRPRVVVLGSGWGAISLCRHIDTNKYEVVCVSPRNYFLMTPLLPSVAVGTLETRAVCEPVRQMLGTTVQYVESDCSSVDPVRKVIKCSTSDPHLTTTSTAPVPDTNFAPSSRVVLDSARTRPVFELAYDVLIVAIGAEVNTFNTPGVAEHAHFLKELPDARRIRVAVSDCFESAATPTQTEEERKRLLNFVVVGGGPTGVEFAAELSDMIEEDLRKVFPKEAHEAKITVIEALDHILSMYDQRISQYTERHFQRKNIDVVANTAVKEVGQAFVAVQRKGAAEVEKWPCAMVVWATGIKPRPLVQHIRNVIGPNVQTNSRALLTNTHLQLLGSPSIFAIGDCSTIQQPRLVHKLADLFKTADTNGDGVLSYSEFTSFINANRREFPQLEIYARKALEAFENKNGSAPKSIDLTEFTSLLEKADSQLRALPATAQVAQQEGYYIAQLLNEAQSLQELESQPIGAPNALQKVGPFRYQHLGTLAYVGGDSAIADFTGVKVLNFLNLQPMSGTGAFWLWRSCYFSETFTNRNRAQLVFDWTRSKVFGRDISRE